MNTTPIEHCAIRDSYPGVECQGSPWLVRVRHPLNGPAWSCLPHALHAVQGEPSVSIMEVDTDALDPEIVSELYRRALLERTGQID
ncbi:MAG TPA: hypothetical protein VNV66_13290 [Pilimelia sp.]|nr:hypothetical protein [Pilimelia sp.]